MSEPREVHPLTRQVADQVLEAGRQLRATELSARMALVAQAEQTRQQAECGRARAGSTEVLLAHELGRLTTRMLEIYEYSQPKWKRWRRAPQSALEVMTDSADELKIVTSPIHDGDILEEHGVHYLQSGLVFSRYTGPIGEKQLFIQQLIKDDFSQAQGRCDLYQLYAYDSASGKRVKVMNDEFSKYTEDKRETIIQTYAEEYPWALERQYSWWSPISERYPSIGKSERDILGGAFEAWSFDEKSKAESNQRAAQLNADLALHMEPGHSWEYPNEMCREPLGMIQEANILLGSK